MPERPAICAMLSSSSISSTWVRAWSCGGRDSVWTPRPGYMERIEHNDICLPYGAEVTGLAQSRLARCASQGSFEGATQGVAPSLEESEFLWSTPSIGNRKT